MSNNFSQLSAGLLLRVLFFAALTVGFAGKSNAQASNTPERKPGLVFFQDHLVSTEKAIPAFHNLFGRALVSIPEMDFVAANDIVIEYDVRIRPDGTVDYVRSSRCNPEYNEYRKGGVCALYQAKFNPVSKKEDQWVKVVYTFPGIHQ